MTNKQLAKQITIISGTALLIFAVVLLWYSEYSIQLVKGL